MVGRHRYAIAGLLFVAYASFYFCRRSLSSSTYTMLNAEVKRFNVEVCVHVMM